jgi:hypothetical protein
MAVDAQIDLVGECWILIFCYKHGIENFFEKPTTLFSENETYQFEEVAYEVF